MAKRENLEFDLGEHWLIELTCHQADGVTPLDITGGDVLLRIASKAALICEITTANGAEILDGPAGLATFVIPKIKQPAAAGAYDYTARAVLAGSGTISDQAFGTITARSTPFVDFP